MADINIVPKAQGAWIALVVALLVIVLVIMWMATEQERNERVTSGAVDEVPAEAAPR